MVLHSNIVERELICITPIIPVKQIWLPVTKDSLYCLTCIAHLMYLESGSLVETDMPIGNGHGCP